MAKERDFRRQSDLVEGSFERQGNGVVMLGSYGWLRRQSDIGHEIGDESAGDE